ncbi:unnamed protein product [Coregonus sp. 'balchen']|nr:unnamed protein product [Coregonus sp. 'balchen']
MGNTNTGTGHRWDNRSMEGDRLKILMHSSTRERGVSDLEADKGPLLDHPTVFRWTGTGKEVSLSGSFNSWTNKIPLTRSSPPGPYHQDPYIPKQEEKFKTLPILPPHLLQVILNKDTGISCDPALLPEPNHVMLNHLYALSIKDGVMVLSATHRYKKKYVTTLM